MPDRIIYEICFDKIGKKFQKRIQTSVILSIRIWILFLESDDRKKANVESLNEPEIYKAL